MNWLERYGAPLAAVAPRPDVEELKLRAGTLRLLREGHGQTLHQLSPPSVRAAVVATVVKAYLAPLAAREELQPYELRAMEAWGTPLVAQWLDAALAM